MKKIYLPLCLIIVATNLTILSLYPNVNDVALSGYNDYESTAKATRIQLKKSFMNGSFRSLGFVPFEAFTEDETLSLIILNEKSFTVQIVNQNGFLVYDKVYSGNTDNKYQIPLDEYAKGSYEIRINQSENSYTGIFSIE
ncbi:MAG: DUF3244 domain-containing protein [Prevotella sp.]|jgi:hypothetical protein|nr:DUF3244 domain-containing protein [Prevotella sp.]